MEKTLTINISGWVFNINENAYEKLTQYFKNLKKHFKPEEGAEEIVADIEARIAELLKEKIGEDHAVVTINHVDELIKVMGQPFEMDEEPGESAFESSSKSKSGHKQLFRDTKSGHIAGVAAGLGKYINLDPIFIRIIFLLLITTGGLGIVLYLVLWVLIPEAVSTSDRIKMEGKKVNIKNIEDKVREETDYLKDRLNDFSEEARNVYQKTAPARRTSLKGIEGFFKGLGRVLLRILKIIIGLVLFIYGVAFLVGFAIIYFNWIPSFEFDHFFVQGLSLPEFLGAFILDTDYVLITIIALSVIIFIPIVMMIFHGVRFIFNLKRNKTVGTIAWQAWLVAFIITIGMSYTTIRAFNKETLNITKYEFEKLQSDTLRLNLNTQSYYADILSSDQKTVISQDNRIPVLKDGEFYGEPRLQILDTDTKDFYLKVYKSARGKSSLEANEHISNIQYAFLIDSTGLTLDPYYMLEGNKKWRYQELILKLYIPKGKYISIDENIGKHFRMDYYWRDILKYHEGPFLYMVNEDGDFIEPNDELETIKELPELEEAESEKETEVIPLTK